MKEEVFLASDYTLYERRPFQIAEGVEHTFRVSIVCPGCHEQHPFLDHGARLECGCGITMHRRGNSLECTVRHLRLLSDPP